MSFKGSFDRYYLRMKNNQEPLVSIIMPVYNGEKTLLRAIYSLYLQTYKNWICIIVNDGSTDNTKTILDNLNDGRLLIIHFEKNKGRPYARQTALEHASGKYLAMLDADDFYHPMKLKIQVTAFENNDDLALVGCGLGSFDSNEQLIRVRGKGNGIVNIYKTKSKFPTSHASSIIRRDLVDGLKYNLKLKQSEDIDFLRRYLLNRNYLLLHNVLYYYSEFESIGKKKSISNHYYALKLASYNLRHISFFSLKNFILSLLKLLAVLIIVPIFGTKLIIHKRGSKPSGDEFSDLQNTINSINKKI